MFIPYHHRRQKLRRMLVIVGGFLLLSIMVYGFVATTSTLTSSESLGPKEVVEQFYAYEQSKDFGSSWELFHPFMQEKFSKQEYIQMRTRVFLQDFGVDSFGVTVGEVQLESSWRMSPDSPVLSNVQKVPVALLYESYFGDLRIEQQVYVAKDDDKQYRILWPYNRQ